MKLFLSAFFSSIFFLAGLFGKNSQVDYSNFAKRLTADFSRKLEKFDGMIPLGSGGAMMNDIQVISLTMLIRKSLSIEQNRKLIVEKSEEFLRMINSDVKIRPFLHDYPFTSKNLDLVFTVESSSISSPCVSIVTVYKCKILYADQDRKYFLTESYEDAVKMLNDSKNN